MFTSNAISFFLNEIELSFISFEIKAKYDGVIIVTIKRFCRINDIIVLDKDGNDYVISNDYGIKTIIANPENTKIYLTEII